MVRTSPPERPSSDQRPSGSDLAVPALREWEDESRRSGGMGGWFDRFSVTGVLMCFGWVCVLLPERLFRSCRGPNNPRGESSGEPCFVRLHLERLARPPTTRSKTTARRVEQRSRTLIWSATSSNARFPTLRTAAWAEQCVFFTASAGAGLHHHPHPLGLEPNILIEAAGTWSDLTSPSLTRTRLNVLDTKNNQNDGQLIFVASTRMIVLNSGRYEHQNIL